MFRISGIRCAAPRDVSSRIGARLGEQSFAGHSVKSLLGVGHRRHGQCRWSVPLTELRLDNVVDVYADAADRALVDFDLVQMCRRVREALR
jgi:hypothetical protein